MAKSKDAKRVIILDGRNKGEADDAELSAFAEDEFEDTGPGGSASFDIIPEEGDNGRYTGKTKKPADSPQTKKRSSKKARRRKHFLVLFIVTAVLMVSAIGAIRTVNNNYHTPIRIYEEYLNKPEYTGEELSEAFANHVAEKQLKRLRELLGRSTEYNDSLNDSLLRSREVYGNNCEEYGDDFRFTISVDGVKKLDSIQIAALRTELNGILSDISSSSFVTAGDPELSRAVSDVISAFEKPGITDGCYVYCTQKVTGSKGDASGEGIHDYHQFIVVKLDGRWIMWDKIYDILKMSY